MAESESGQDKTEDPTEKRKKDSREKGEIARSKELNTLAIMLAGSGGLLIYGGGLALDLMELMRLNFSLPRDVLLSPGAMGLYLLHSGKIAILAVQPILITLLLAALIGPISLGGWLFAAGSLAPKFSRMNPAAGLKRMFSTKALVELLKALAKFILILFVALTVLSSDIDDLLRIAHEPIELAIIHSVQVVGWSSLWMACGLIIIAAVDAPIQQGADDDLLGDQHHCTEVQGIHRWHRRQARHDDHGDRHREIQADAPWYQGGAEHRHGHQHGRDPEQRQDERGHPGADLGVGQGQHRIHGVSRSTAEYCRTAAGCIP